MDRQIIHSACQHDCPDNCSMQTVVVNGRAESVSGRAEHPFTRGVLCAKVKSFDQRVYSDQRILHPMRRIGAKGQGKFERIGWDEALNTIAQNFRAIVQTNGAQAILPFNYLGSQGLLNGMHCGDPFFNRLGASVGERTFCNSGASKAFRMVSGPTGGLDPESFVHSRFILLWGINVVSTSMHHWRFIQDAIRQGAELVVIDPLKSKTASQATWHVRPRPGTDVVLALAIVHQLIADDLLDHDYIARFTEGFDAFEERSRQFPPATASSLCGVAEQDIIRLARAIGQSRPLAIRTGVALERSRNGPDAVRAIASLPALTGAWRDVGGGMFQHPQGTFPIQREKLTMSVLGEKHRRAINLFDIASALRPDAADPIKSLFVFNANPVTAAANQNGIVQGLARDDLFTVVSEVFPTDATDYADIVLPACTQLEQLDLMYSWGHFNLQINEPAIDPVGEAVSNTELFRRLAKKMDFSEAALYRTDEQLLADALDWNAPQLQGHSLASLRAQGYLRLAVGDPATRLPHSSGQFPTPSGRFEFVSSVADCGGEMLDVYRQGITDTSGGPVDPLPDYLPETMSQPGDTPAMAADGGPFVLLSPKTHHFLNSGYTNLGPQASRAGDQPVWIHPDDAAEWQISDGQRLRVFNALGEVHGNARVTDDTMPGVLVITHGYWRKHVGGATVNALVPNRPAAIGRAPTINDTRVDIDVAL